MEELTDATLFSRVTQGDTAAFAAFYERHEARWFGLVMRIVSSQAEAEDVLQEAAVLVWERAGMYDATQGQPGAWAATVVRNKAIDRVRVGRRRGEALNRLAACEDCAGPMSPAAPVDTWGDDSADLVRQTLGLLPSEQRRAIEMAFFGGLTQSEISEQLGQPLGTVKARIRRGMLTLRDALEGVL